MEIIVDALILFLSMFIVTTFALGGMLLSVLYLWYTAGIAMTALIVIGKTCLAGAVIGALVAWLLARER